MYKTTVEVTRGEEVVKIFEIPSEVLGHRTLRPTFLRTAIGGMKDLHESLILDRFQVQQVPKLMVPSLEEQSLIKTVMEIELPENCYLEMYRAVYTYPFERDGLTRTITIYDASVRPYIDASFEKTPLANRLLSVLGAFSHGVSRLATIPVSFGRYTIRDPILEIRPAGLETDQNVRKAILYAMSIALLRGILRPEMVAMMPTQIVELAAKDVAGLSDRRNVSPLELARDLYNANRVVLEKYCENGLLEYRIGESNDF